MDSQGQFGCHPAAGLANLYVSDCTANPDLLSGRTNGEHAATCGQAEDLRTEGDEANGGNNWVRLGAGRSIAARVS